MVRFLPSEEYGRTLPLFTECFGEDEAFCRRYYGEQGQGDIYRGRVAVLEEDGEILSMVHVKDMTLRTSAVVAADVEKYVLPRLTDTKPEEVCFAYLLCIGTAVNHRGRGYMDEVMTFVENELRQNGCQFSFLVAVDKAIYKSRGYEYHFPLSADSQGQLYADEGLTEGTVKFL